MKLTIERKGFCGRTESVIFDEITALSPVQYKKRQIIYGIAAKAVGRFIVIAEFIIPSERNIMLDRIIKASEETKNIQVSYLWQYRTMPDNKARVLLRRKVRDKAKALSNAIEKARKKAEQWNVPFDYDNLKGDNAAYKHGWALPVPTKITLLGINPEQYFSYLLT